MVAVEGGEIGRAGKFMAGNSGGLGSVGIGVAVASVQPDSFLGALRTVPLPPKILFFAGSSEGERGKPHRDDAFAVRSSAPHTLGVGAGGT